MAVFPPTKRSEIGIFFAAHILERGQELFSSGKVKLLECNSTRISAQVQGSENRPYMVWVDAQYHYGCNCPSDTQPCKHVAATLLNALEVKPTSPIPFNLQNYLDNLEPEKAKTLLLELAQIPSVRLVLLERNLQGADSLVNSEEDSEEDSEDSESSTYFHPSNLPTYSVQELCYLLERRGDIEDESELGETAFEELLHYPPEERKNWAKRLLKSLGKYDYDGYDPEKDYNDDYDYNEGGEVYWEDQVFNWKKLALQSLGTAIHDLGHRRDSFAAYLEEFYQDYQTWPLVFELARGDQDLIARLQAGLNHVKILSTHSHYVDGWFKEFFSELGTDQQYLHYMHSRLRSTTSYLELVKVLIDRNQLEEALDIAVQGVRNLESLDYVDVSPMALLLELLIRHQPNLEWNEQIFRIRPTLDNYHYLRQNHPQFIGLRNQWLESKHMPLELKIQILCDENDLAALEQILKKRATPDVAAQISPLLPHLCRPIFKKAVLEGISEGQRTGYAKGATWAEEYRKVEDPAVFRVWLLELLKVNIRRPALQDEFGKVRMKLNTP
jgi:hypothetical protein